MTTLYTCTGCKATSTNLPPACGCGKPITASMTATAHGSGGLKG